jgi:hypothetical protein
MSNDIATTGVSEVYSRGFKKLLLKKKQFTHADLKNIYIILLNLIIFYIFLNECK